MIKLRCLRCNFSFDKEENAKIIICPNCGGKEKIIKEQSAEELLDEI